VTGGNGGGHRPAGDVALRHRQQRDESPQIALRWRNEFSSGILELIDQLGCSLAARRFAI